MKFFIDPRNPHIAYSQCRNYRIEISMANFAFYNAWYVPTNKHIEASYDKQLVIARCETHAGQQQVAA